MRKKTKAFIYCLDFLFLNASYITAVLVKRKIIELNADNINLILVFYGIWLVSYLLSNKLRLNKPDTIRKGLEPFFRFFVYFSVILFFIHFFFELFVYSRFIILATLLIYFFLNITAYVFYYLKNWGPNVETIEDEADIQEKARGEEPEKEVHIDEKHRVIKEPLKEKLQNQHLKDYPQIFGFINSIINLKGISASNTLILDTNISYSVESVLSNGFEFIGNIHRINDIRRINKFFNSVNNKLILGGFFFGCVETIEQRRERKFSRYPGFIGKTLYFFDFIWTRMFPKLPGLKKIYFIYHGKDRRILSNIEIMGRLKCCGFKVIKSEVIDNTLYFLARKVKSPFLDKDASFGPVFKQKRIGRNGELLYTYKFRTMYPYSEYLHDSVYNAHKLNNIGKIKNDPRVTRWGRFMRRYFLDEIPMLVNFFQGDLKLVGIRPLSRSFFSIYPERLKKQRTKHKPGLLPAIYADLPRSKEAIFEAERKYLNRFEKHPLRTDIVYFFKVLGNIIFRQARSG
ncbi:MAG: sugar transferase [Candidatus Aminicenantes bacterium]|nr:sugar transferase [Candidatus Aminicenantes bacterium]